MPGISNIIQKELGIKTCIAFDILAGCSGFINAIDIAKKSARKGEVVLFSPASASFDMFKNFADRGEKFKKLVNNI